MGSPRKFDKFLFAALVVAIATLAWLSYRGVGIIAGMLKPG
jgi:hypothetical protein